MGRNKKIYLDDLNAVESGLIKDWITAEDMLFPAHLLQLHSF